MTRIHILIYGEASTLEVEESEILSDILKKALKGKTVIPLNELEIRYISGEQISNLSYTLSEYQMSNPWLHVSPKIGCGG